jgi:protein-L-isoaspartate(D-aspartate) O-methyltransferase
MSENLKLRPGDRVLEIGTGSGYQAAILADMGMEVYSIEIVPELATEADARLKRLGYEAQVRAGDGYDGWPDAAPFDAIIVTAAPDHVPLPLLEQLKVGGRLVVPIGPVGAIQTLWQFTLEEGDHLKALNLGDVRFVPFTRSAQTP